MAIESAVKFIRHAVSDNTVKEKLKDVRTSDKTAAVAEIVRIGKESGFDFTEAEYEEAAAGAYTLLNVKEKGIEELKTIEDAPLSNCSCTGCSACAACLTCLACISCAWCVVIPFGGEAVIAADAASAISAATIASVGVSTAVATAAQGA
ncbi:MAG: Nif11-like leader peptide family natural product precursor [Treponema sp.]|jgi:predicted ribosomally synthesized peptide with nif11-like leader|nr:Nif11-like leader peptide family natural product precursor [Treponema sp.]